MNKDDLVISLNSIVQLGYVGMIEPFQESDLTANRLLTLDVLNFLFLVDLECNCLTTLAVSALSDNCIGPLSNLLA